MMARKKRDQLAPDKHGNKLITCQFTERELTILREAMDTITKREGKAPSISQLLRYCVLRADFTDFPPLL